MQSRLRPIKKPLQYRGSRSFVYLSTVLFLNGRLTYQFIDSRLWHQYFICLLNNNRV